MEKDPAKNRVIRLPVILPLAWIMILPYARAEGKTASADSGKTVLSVKSEIREEKDVLMGWWYDIRDGMTDSWSACTAPAGCSGQVVREHLPKGLTKLMQQPKTKFFMVERNASGTWTSGHSDSYYVKMISPDAPCFVTANGAFAAQIRPDGSLGQTCVFSGETVRNGEKRTYPGGWVTWKRELAKAPDFRIELENELIMPATDWPVRTSFLLNAIPVSEYTAPKLSLQVIACAPVSVDGQRRPRGLIRAILIRNTSSAPVEGALSLTENEEMNVKGLEGRTVFRLPPGGESWYPVLLTMKNDDTAMEELSGRNADTWLEDTYLYWQRVTGNLTMPGNPFTAELFTRCNVLALQSGVFNGQGQAVGVLYGLSPFHGSDNFRDSYYAILPATLRDPSYLRPFIAWFNQYSTHPPTPKFPLDILHSLGNTLNGTMLAGMYYQATGDRKYFADNPDLVNLLRGTMEAILATRKAGDPWLFGSAYISDGRSLGDYHTGSNVCMWRSLLSFAEILEEACNDTRTAARYRSIAAKVKADLDRYNIKADAPFGPQYVEGTNADGSVPVSVHDGEESDTPLMPAYGYCSVDFPPYQNFMRFAVSSQNVAFCPETRGIIWETYGLNPKVLPVGPHIADATFPGYITALAGCTDTASLYGHEGYLTEIRRLTDVNGSFWWWPYRKEDRRGNVRRGPFECGWAEGVFPVMFQANFLGLNYDAPGQDLRFAPNPATGDFSWMDAPLGNQHFSVTCAYQPASTTATVENLTGHPVSLKAMLTFSGTDPKVFVNNKRLRKLHQQTYLGLDAVLVAAELPAKGKVQIVIQ